MEVTSDEGDRPGEGVGMGVTGAGGSGDGDAGSEGGEVGRSESEDGDDVSMNDNDGKGRKRKRGMRGSGRDSSNVNDIEASEELAKTAGSSNGGSGSVPSGNRGSDIKVSEELAKVLQNGSLAEISAFFSERGLACGLSADKCIIYDGENKHGKSFKLSGVEAALKHEGVSSADIRKHSGAFHARVSTEEAGRLCGGGTRNCDCALTGSVSTLPNRASTCLMLNYMPQGC